VVTNFHAFKLREKLKASKTTKGLLGNGEVFTETPGQMVSRVCRGLGNKKNILVLNDEAHHCYRRRVGDQDEVKLKGDEKEEAKKREEYARVWISGLDAVREKKGIRLVYDLSATPFFLRGSGYSKITADGRKITEGLLFPWVVSDFSLVDAIECGIVKVPRVPVSVRGELPKKGRKTKEYTGDPKLPQHLEGALRSLYGNYEKSCRQWEADKDARARGQTPPVFIIVCNNTNVSKMVFDWIAGYEKQVSEDETVIVPGNLTIFRNSEGDQWLRRPNTILVDSQQLESGEAMSPEFKRVAAREIEEFKHEYTIRFQGRDAGKLTDEDLLREVMNTVGKQGKLGEQIKCVVSVSMLTEGWDANTVTHVLGVRAFGTQLLCEQVVGRGLRRTDYTPNDDGMFEPQYAEVYGVPFSFIPCSGSTTIVKPPKPTMRVRALEEREDCMIRFPLLQGYKYEIADTKLDVRFTEDSRYVLSTEAIPTKVENAPIVGESSIHTLDDLKKRRPQEVAFLLGKLVLERYFNLDPDVAKEDKPKEHRFERNVQVWLFPQVLEIARRWLDECVRCKDNCFPQMLLFIEPAHDAADKIYRSIAASSTGEKLLKPLLQPYECEGSTRHVDFNTARPVYATRRDKCHVSHVVADTNSWEQKTAQTLEDMDEVVHYVKNHNIGFVIPYTLQGDERKYYPDFVAHVRDGHGDDDLLNLIVEVTGRKKKDKEAKVATARNLWVPAVNNHGGFGRWSFVEIRDPWDAMREIREFLSQDSR
jgi:type III restriction enzyme